MTPPNLTKTKRNVRSLFILGIVMTLLSSIGGGLILVLAYSQPNITQPLWKPGQFMMLQGLLNLVIYLALFFQVRILTKATGAKEVP